MQDAAQDPWDDAEGNAVRLQDHSVLPKPEPSMGAQAYLDEREAALNFDPRRRANFEKYRAWRRDRAEIDYLPIKLDIENVSRCNFRCTMCQVSDWAKGQRAEDLSLEDFKRVLDSQYGVVEIKLQGMGEPLMQRDAYFEMIRHARASRIWVRTTTNASLLHLKENHKTLIDTDANEIQISIDGATKDVFESIRRQSDFDRVVANCKAINKYSRERGVRRTKMWVVLQRANRHQMEDLLELSAELGFEDLVYSLNLTDWGQETWRASNRGVTVEDSIVTDRCLSLVERGKALGVKVAFWSITEKFDASKPETICPWPFERAYVSSDARVVPCCMIANPEVLDLGDARDFAKTWFSKTYVDFRQAHIDNRIPKACESCYLRDAHWPEAKRASA